MSLAEIEFERLEKTFVQIIKKEFDKRIERARNKDLVKAELIKDHLSQYHLCFSLNKYRNDLLESFQYNYERGYPIIDKMIERIIQHQESYKRNGMKMPDTFFGTANPKQIVRFFAKYTAYQTFIGYLSKEHPEVYADYERQIKAQVQQRAAIDEETDDFKMDFHLPPQPFNRTDSIVSALKGSETIEAVSLHNENISFSPNLVYWRGKNKTEFVQFVYALFEAGFIANESGEVTKLVEQLAQLFQFDVGSNWQSNHSKSINNRNNDYEPEIFDRLKKSYAVYTEQLIQGTKNRKKS